MKKPGESDLKFREGGQGLVKAIKVSRKLPKCHESYQNLVKATKIFELKFFR